MKTIAIAVSVLVVGGIGIGAIVAAKSNSPPRPPVEQAGVAVTEAAESEPESSALGIAAIDQAAKDNKYLFLFFAKEESGETVAMRAVFESAIAEINDRANSVEIDIKNPSERPIVDKCGVDRAPMPLVLAMAPNGAITGGFPTKFEKKDLLEAFATPCTEKCMKHLQDGKLVFLCVHNTNTNSNEPAMQGVRDFKADERFAEAAEIVDLDPSDAAEADFLADLQISPETEQAVTVFLAPPGAPIGVFEGATNKDQLVDLLMKASSACGPGGCGPGGCAPR